MPHERARAARHSMSLRAIGREGFFADKDRAFWLLQVGGWMGYFTLRALGGLANNMGLAFVLPTAIITITGFSLTLLMAAAFRRVIEMRVVFVWTLTLLLVIAASALFSVLEVWATATFYRPGWQPVGMEFFGGILLDLSVLGAWTGLYYGINYYLLLSEQGHAMDRVSARANAAQLTMLRYQLNPHFLFNTLNSISTLVLLKQSERANAMLSRLSSFLRYSLGEPAELVTVAQEVEALKLYLDIEKMRFEERLRPHFVVEAPAHVALIPSLLLQPLVENAVKYAVTPLEEGAEVRVHAKQREGRVIVSVADTGPGMGSAPAASRGVGVGLQNIRDRLEQTYGDDQRLEVKANLPRGLVVTIDIPFQPASVATREAA